MRVFHHEGQQHVVEHSLNSPSLPLLRIDPSPAATRRARASCLYAVSINFFFEPLIGSICKPDCSRSRRRVCTFLAGSVASHLGDRATGPAKSAEYLGWDHRVDSSRQLLRRHRRTSVFGRVSADQDRPVDRIELARDSSSSTQGIHTPADGAPWKVEHDGCHAAGVPGHAGQAWKSCSIPIRTGHHCLHPVRVDEHDCVALFRSAFNLGHD